MRDDALDAPPEGRGGAGISATGPSGSAAAAATQDPEDADRDAFAAIVFAAVDELRAALQEPYATQLGEIAIVTEDQAPPEKRPPGGDLYGLFEGVPRNRWAADWVVVPAQITIYRRTHEAFFRDRASLEAGVRSTVRHEVAHYFGTDEAGIRAIERESRTEPPR